ncbi:MAG: hypothetical protein ACJ76Z_02885 [Thermoleophilaceae bacterium]
MDPEITGEDGATTPESKLSSGDVAARDALDRRDGITQEFDQLLSELATSPGPIQGPSAEGITLWGGLHSHRMNGSLPAVVDDAIDFLADRSDVSRDTPEP